MFKRDKERIKLHEIYKVGDRYHCAVCGTEIQFGDSYPNQKKETNWAVVRFIARPF